MTPEYCHKISFLPSIKFDIGNKNTYDIKGHVNKQIYKLRIPIAQKN